MQALIAIDSFKNSMTSIQANQTVATAFAEHDIQSQQIAIADGVWLFSNKTLSRD